MLYINSEYKKLKKIIVHEPGKELENITPLLMKEFLFDDIPFLKKAIEEHRYFVKILKDNGVDVYYLKDLLKDVLDISNDIKNSFINNIVWEAEIFSVTLSKVTYQYLLNLDNEELINKVISGVKKIDLPDSKMRSLTDFVDESPFVLKPMINLYFQRDPAVIIKDMIINSSMNTKVRQRETLLLDYIIKYHPLFKDNKDNVIFERSNVSSLEGGDVFTLSDDILMIGISERTNPYSIDQLARKLLRNNKFSYILAVDIPKLRAFMHLDTLMSQVSEDAFIVHPILKKDISSYLIYLDQDRNRKIVKNTQKLQVILSNLLKKDIKFIQCGGEDEFNSYREQWNDGANVMCIDNKVVISYDRNQISNKILKDNGITVLEIPSSEISRGRGGPRCMSFPIERKK